MSLCADDLEMIVQVREGCLQAGAQAESGVPVDGLRDGSAKLEIIGEHGFCVLKITLLDRIHECLDGFSSIHNAFLYY